MKIAVVCSDMGIRVPGHKGASIHLQSIAKAFAAIGHDVLVFGVAGHEPPPPELACRLLAHPGRSEGLRRELRKVRFNERFARLNEEAMRDFAPDVIYERLALFATAGSRLADACGATHVVEVNALLSREEQQWRGLHLSSLARRRERAVLRHAHLRVAVSEEVARQVIDTAAGRPTAVVANGFDGELFATRPDQTKARRTLGLPEGAILAGFAGALRPWHGIDNAIAALAHTDPRVHLVVAGDGPLKSELIALAESHDVSGRVSWLGQIDHRAMPVFLASLDMALAPYPALDSFSFSPLKLYEYAAAGVPVVASAIGQVCEVLEGGALGTLVAPGDAAALGAAIHSIASDPYEARRRAGVARRCAFEKHTWNQRATDIVDLITRESYAVAS